jgi:hypothetical protein
MGECPLTRHPTPGPTAPHPELLGHSDGERSLTPRLGKDDRPAEQWVRAQRAAEERPFLRQETADVEVETFATCSFPLGAPTKSGQAPPSIRVINFGVKTDFEKSKTYFVAKQLPSAPPHAEPAPAAGAVRPHDDRLHQQLREGGSPKS